MNMMMPKTASGWCMWLFFLFFGLSAFLGMPILGTLTAILALAYAVLSLIGM